MLESLIDLGFSKYNRKDTYDFADSLKSKIPLWGIEDDLIDNLVPSKLLDGSLKGEFEMTDGFMQSSDYVADTTGWKLPPTGDPDIPYLESDISDNADDIDDLELTSFTLGENLTAGKLVALKGDGKIYDVYQAATDYFDSDLSENASDGMEYRKAVYLSDNKFLLTGYDTPPLAVRTKHIVGNVFDRAITYGNLSTGATGSGGGGILTDCMLTSTLVITSENIKTSGNDYIRLRAIQIDANDDITIGAATTTSDERADAGIALCRLDDDKFACLYSADLGPSVLRVVIGTVSGGVITLDEANQYDLAENGSAVSMCQLDTDKFLLNYRDPNSPFYGKCMGGSVTGTTPTVDEANVAASSSAAINASYYVTHLEKLDTDTAILSYILANSSRAAVVTVSGTVPTVNASVQVEGTIGIYTYHHLAVLDTDLFVYSSSTSIYKGSISGTTITMDSPVARASIGELNGTTRWDVCKLETATSKFLDAGNANGGTNSECTAGKAVASELLGAQYVGVLQENGSTDESKRVARTGQISPIHSDLAEGYLYYINSSDGTLTVDDSETYIAGQATASTDLLIIKQ